MSNFDEQIERTAEQDLRESDARKRDVSKRIPTESAFRSNFIATYADQIEMIRRGAVVTETEAERKARQGVAHTITAEDYTRPAAVVMPDNKPVPTLASAKRAIFWSRVTRPFRRLWARIVAWWRRLWTR